MKDYTKKIIEYRNLSNTSLDTWLFLSPCSSPYPHSRSGPVRKPIIRLISAIIEIGHVYACLRQRKLSTAKREIGGGCDRLKHFMFWCLPVNIDCTLVGNHRDGGIDTIFLPMPQEA